MVHLMFIWEVTKFLCHNPLFINSEVYYLWWTGQYPVAIFVDVQIIFYQMTWNWMQIQADQQTAVRQIDPKN